MSKHLDRLDGGIGQDCPCPTQNKCNNERIEPGDTYYIQQQLPNGYSLLPGGDPHTDDHLHRRVDNDVQHTKLETFITKGEQDDRQPVVTAVVEEESECARNARIVIPVEESEQHGPDDE